MSNSNKIARFSFSWRIFLPCALILSATALFPNLYLPHPTYAIAQIQPKQPLANEASLTPTMNTKSIPLEKLATTPSIWPVSGTVTSSFGWRKSPFGNSSELHAGIDIAVNAGTPVVATADGLVVQSGPFGGYGNLVQIDHGNGISTLYGHNSQIAVNIGQSVKKGQVVSYAGSTGNSTGPHVHYEVRENDTSIDPWKYLVSHKQHV